MRERSYRLTAFLLICVFVLCQALSVAATDVSENEGDTETFFSETSAESEGETEVPVETEAAPEEEALTESGESAETESGESAETESIPLFGTDDETEATTEPVPDIEYQTHVQTYGWKQGWVENGRDAGTTGEAKRLECIRIRVKNTELSGDVRYRTHVQTYGWRDWSYNGGDNGSIGEAKRLEGIRIELTGELAEKYDIYYCVHVEKLGWLNWAKNGEMAGTSGLAKRLEAIKIVLVRKGEAAPAPVGSAQSSYANLPGVTYRVHQQTYGTMDWVANGQTAGVTGKSKRMESLAVKLTGDHKLSGNMEYRTHVQTYGWRGWTGDGTLNGSSGEAKRLEALQVRLTGDLEKVCDVYYRLHVQGYGWLGWAKNGEMAGTSGLALRVEAIEIRLGAKGGSVPVSLGGTAYHAYSGPGFYKIGNQNIYYSANGVRGGATGWTRKDGKRYYLVNGLPVTGWRYIGGLKYYFNGDGSLCQNVDGIIGPQSSYHIKVNKEANCVTIYAQDGANGYIIPVKAMLCSTGDDTPLGTRPTLGKYRWQSMFNGTEAQYATRLTSAPGVLFHSVTYESRNIRTMLTLGYNGMGVVRSAGCIRLFCGEAYWLYSRCPVGTLVTVYNDANPGPFDRPTFTPIPENQRWDPTDPNL
jgi:uncharacterized protein YjdB